MFNIGDSVLTLGGKEVVIVDAKSVGNPFHRVLGDDGFWRDASPGNAGKVMGERKPNATNHLDFKVDRPKAQKSDKPQKKPDFWGKNKRKRHRE